MECNLTTQPEHFAITPEIIVKKRKRKIASTNYDWKRKPKLVNNRESKRHPWLLCPSAIKHQGGICQSKPLPV